MVGVNEKKKVKKGLSHKTGLESVYSCPGLHKNNFDSYFSQNTDGETALNIHFLEGKFILDIQIHTLSYPERPDPDLLCLLQYIQKHVTHS